MAFITAGRTIEVPRDTYSLRYSPRLVRTGADFYDTLVVAAKMAVCLPTAGEEQYIYSQKILGAKNLRDVEELRDYFANNDKGLHVRGWTTTGLRFREADLRKPYNVGYKVTALVIETDITPYLSQIADPHFARDNWKDIVGKVTHIKGEVAVPYARGHVIREMHPTLGIFTEVEPTTQHNASYVLHGWTRENLNVSQDPITGKYDVAVNYRGDWHRTEGCLSVGVGFERWVSDSDVGFRPVVRAN
ncbi:MAG: hypothetical protein HY365_02975 [Candidatus Aenigmarchaeota archaeon]|nr:hypothetical protein [Candidatus Aenigmarchaeota archaeon]